MICEYRGRWDDATDTAAHLLTTSRISSMGATVLCEQGDHEVERPHRLLETGDALAAGAQVCGAPDPRQRLVLGHEVARVVDALHHRSQDPDAPFGLAQALLGHGEALLTQCDHAGAAPLVDEVHALFVALGARSCVERASRTVPAAA